MTVKRDAARMANVPWPPHDFTAAVQRLLVLDDDDWVVSGCISETFMARLREEPDDWVDYGGSTAWWNTVTTFEWLRQINLRLVRRYGRPEGRRNWMRMNLFDGCGCAQACSDNKDVVRGLNGVYGNFTNLQVPTKYTDLAEFDAKRFAHAQ